ncbi:MAG: capsular polysaccharide biosynthesis protein [Eubacteriales bacterium]|nr:capsular polysaccharide biosynthesis protein [Eubacteriales bacterium]
MTVIDFHSHILPAIDDGSRDLETTEQLLRMSLDKGVGLMVATPHFYATQDRVDDFLKRRKNALEKTLELPQERRPRILAGAEVAFFEGISRTDRLPELTVQGSDILLLEMPFCPWERRTLEELEELSTEYRVILAHLERYLKIPGNKKLIDQALELPVYVQINAGSLLDWKRRGAILKMFKKGQAHLLGSDTHSLNRRPPNLDEGRMVLEKKLGRSVLDEIDRRGNELLGDL